MLSRHGYRVQGHALWRGGAVATIASALVVFTGCTKQDAPRADSGTMSASGDTARTPAATGTTASADAEMQAVLDQLAAMGGKPIETLTPQEARQQPTPAAAAMIVAAKAGKDTTPTALVPGVSSADRTIPGAAGPVPVRIYTPDGAGPFPVVVYYHGGGWVIASKEVYDGGARSIAKTANAVVVSVDYGRRLSTHSPRNMTTRSRHTAGPSRTPPQSRAIPLASRSRAKARAAISRSRRRWAHAMRS